MSLTPQGEQPSKTTPAEWMGIALIGIVIIGLWLWIHTNYIQSGPLYSAPRQHVNGYVVYGNDDLARVSVSVHVIATTKEEEHILHVEQGMKRDRTAIQRAIEWAERK